MNQATVPARTADMFDAAGDDLVTVLNSLDVPFLAGGTSGGQALDITPSSLLARLAASPEARLRLALIPLLLRHPQFSAQASAVLEALPATAASVLKCYFVAAALLQRKYWERLQSLGMPALALPPLFFAELAIPYPCNPDDGLKLLADRQAILSERFINWLGTYEHAAQRFLTHMERRITWRT